MTGEVDASAKGPNVVGQIVAALLLCGALAGGLWVLQKHNAERADAAGPASCSTDKETAPPANRVSGTQLCTALNRSDLAVLLGTPQEHAVSASGSDGSVETAGGTKIYSPESTVQLGTYTVKLSRSYDKLPVAGSETLLNAAQKKTILGHPAVLYTGQTIAIRFNLGGGKSESGPGGLTRSLLIAPDAKDSGGSYELAVYRQDGGLPPGDETVLRLAEQILPTLPGWTTTAG